MKLTILQENLKNAVNLTSHFITPRAQLPILANILLRTDKSKLVLSSTNLETSVSISVGAKIEEEGDITIPGKTFSDLILNLSSGPVNLISDKEQLKITSGLFKSKLMGINSFDFPQIPGSVGKDVISIPREDFINCLNKTLFAVSNDETRPVLTGVLFKFTKEGLKLVATDGFRLSEKTLSNVKINDEMSLIIPKTILYELVKLTEGEIIEFSYKSKDNQVVFGVGDITFSSRVIEGDFPDYEKIIPKTSLVDVETDKIDLEKAVKLASVFARDASNIIKLKIENNKLKILAESSSSGSQETEVEAKTESKSEEDLEISFNYKFIEDLLKSIKGDLLKIEFGGNNTAGKFFDPEDRNFLHLIMPIKIQE